MLQEEQRERKQGAITVLALFIAVLFGHGGVASAAELNERATRLGQTDAARQGAILRALPRGSVDESEADEPALDLPPQTDVQRDVVPTFPANAPAVGAEPAAASGRPLPYRARAPPAA